ncbi:MAG TPA: hypothetical protein VES40_04880 [Ilumatobacteraceae bacterium]|nr:hypothetical protein [Ilumatobacteraceae bacterium]
MVDCIFDAAENGEAKELEFLRPGTDCCVLRYVIRVLGPSQVEQFWSSDGDPWYLSRCEGVGLTDEPFGFPEAKDCAIPLELKDAAEGTIT